MSWQPWSSSNPGVVPGLTGLPPVVNPAPAVLPSGSQYTPEQWTQMQHQNWQQWAQWQQQYQQWHQQYGAEYQKSISALSQPTAARSTFQPPVPNTSVPPPLPAEVKPPLPPEEPPKELTPQISNKNEPNFMSGPPPLFNTAPPQIQAQSHFKQSSQTHNQPPPNIRTNQSGNYNYKSNRSTNQNQYNDTPRSSGNAPPRSDHTGEKRPIQQPTFNDPKKSKIEDASNVTSQTSGSNEDMSETEKKFVKQFTEWEAQFNKWKEQNMNHPDKEQYREYEKKWEAWRTQLLERREQMRRKRLGLAEPKTNSESKSLLPPPLKQPPFPAGIPPLLPKGIDTTKPPPVIAANTSVSNDFATPKEDLLSITKELCMDTNILEKQDSSTNDFSHENFEEVIDDGSTFLKLSSINEGIPGLDLVKDNKEDEKREDVIDLDNENMNKIEDDDKNKGPDLEAISKGINNILGDQKLLNMLSMVSQSQINQTPSSNVDTTSKIQTNPDPQVNLKNINDGSNQGGDRWSNIDEYYRNNDNVSGGRGGGDFDCGDKYNKRGGTYSGGYNNQNEFNTGMENYDGNYDNKFDGGDFEKSATFFFYKDRRTNNFGASRNNLRNSEQFRDSNPIGPNVGENENHQITFEPPPDNFRPSDRNFRRGPKGQQQNFGQNDNFQNMDNNYNRPGNFTARFDNRQNNRPGNFTARFDNRQNLSSFGNDGDIPSNNFQPGVSRQGPNNFKGGLEPQSNYEDPNQFTSEEFDHDLNNDFNRGSNFGRKNFTGGPGNFNNDGFGNRSDNMGEWSNQEKDNLDKDQEYNDNNLARQNFESIPHLETNDNAETPVIEEEDINKSEKEELWQPTNIIEYDHKSSKSDDDPEVSLDPLRTFDYRHKPVNRIPFPQRPKWLVGLLKKFPEFDFAIPRSYDQPYHRYQERYSDAGRHENRWNNRDPPGAIRRTGDELSTSRRIVDEPPITRRRVDDLVGSRRRMDDHPVSRKIMEDLPGSRRSINEPFSNKRSIEEQLRMQKRYDNEEQSRMQKRYDNEEQPRMQKRYDNEEQPRMQKRYDNEEQPRMQKRYDNYGPPVNRRFQDETGYATNDNDKYDKRSENMETRDDTSYDRYRNKSFLEEKIPDVNKLDTEKLSPIENKPRTNSNVTLIQDILNPPGRYNRPARIVIILRGPPGSGKTFLAKLIKDKEVENGGSAPRILSLDDYFMVEQEKEVMEDGKKTKVKEMVYEYEECMENTYRVSLFKAFKKTITDGYFPFIIVDNVNEKVKYFGEMWSFAKQNGFQVYICQMEFDVSTCTKRNIHGRSEIEIDRLISNWEPTPAHHPTLDATSLIQSGSIPEVEMEEINSPPSEDFDAQDAEDRMCRSKWDNFDCSIDNLAKLDGTSKRPRPSKTMEDYLQCDDDWVSRESTKPGQKRVRWADLEERKEQEKMRAIGFVVGQTNWDRMMDPTMGSSALTQTKYIERVNNPRFYME